MRLWRLRYDLSSKVRELVAVRVPEGEERWRDVISAIARYMQELGEPLTIRVMGSDEDLRVNVTADLMEMASSLFRTYRGRIGLVRHLLRDVKGPVTVISDSLPVDVIDWVDELRDWTFVIVGDEQDESCSGVWSGDIKSLKGKLKVVSPTELCSLASKVMTGDLEVMIAGPGFLPLRVDLEGDVHRGFISHERVSLEERPEGLALKLRLKASEARTLHLEAYGSERPTLTVISPSGQVEREGIEEGRWFEDLSWNPLPELSLEVIRQVLERGEYVCPYCGDVHSSEVLLCPVGELIFPGLPIGYVSIIRGGEYLPMTEVMAYTYSDEEAVLWDGRLIRRVDDTWKVSGRLRPGLMRLSDEVIALYNLV